MTQTMIAVALGLIIGYWLWKQIEAARDRRFVRDALTFSPLKPARKPVQVWWDGRGGPWTATIVGAAMTAAPFLVGMPDAVASMLAAVGVTLPEPAMPTSKDRMRWFVLAAFGGFGLLFTAVGAYCIRDSRRAS